MDKLRNSMLTAYPSPVKSARGTSIMAHFHEFSDIISEEGLVVQEINKAPKKKLNKPEMKVEISSIDSIETHERVPTNEQQEPACTSFRNNIEGDTANSNEKARQSALPTKAVNAYIAESSGKLMNCDANDESPQLNIPDTQ